MHVHETFTLCGFLLQEYLVCWIFTGIMFKERVLDQRIVMKTPTHTNTHTCFLLKMRNSLYISEFYELHPAV